MSDFEQLERYSVLLYMAETAFQEIGDAVSLEFCQAMARIFAVVPNRISFGMDPEDIHLELMQKARSRGLDHFVMRLRERSERHVLAEGDGAGLVRQD